MSSFSRMGNNHSVSQHNYQKYKKDLEIAKAMFKERDSKSNKSIKINNKVNKTDLIHQKGQGKNDEMYYSVYRKSSNLISNVSSHKSKKMIKN